MGWNHQLVNSMVFWKRPAFWSLFLVNNSRGLFFKWSLTCRAELCSHLWLQGQKSNISSTPKKQKNMVSGCFREVVFKYCAWILWGIYLSVKLLHMGCIPVELIRFIVHVLWLLNNVYRHVIQLSAYLVYSTDCVYILCICRLCAKWNEIIWWSGWQHFCL